MLEVVESAPTTISRRTKRFSWSKVDQSLIRDLLFAAYEAGEQFDEAKKVAGWPESALEKNAIRVLGEPLNPKHIHASVDVLREKWLPTVAPKRLNEFTDEIQLGLTGPIRTVSLPTKALQLQFLQTRKRSDNFKKQLRRFFLREHTVEQWIEVVKQPPQPIGIGAVDLVGEGAADHRIPFPFQKETWKSLSKLQGGDQSRSGLIVLPTGAGKTYTMVHWLLKEMLDRPDLRVLWLADRQELINQAARTFADLASCMPPTFTRRLRAIHSNGNPPSSLADPKLDVAVITRQSIIGSFNGLGKRRLEKFLSRPTVVVVDEAHHAVAPDYDRMLTEISRVGDALIVGLTATPWPAGYGAVRKLRTRFESRLTEVSVAELITAGTLARPTIHSISTNVTMTLDDLERKQAIAGDLPPSVLRRLDQDDRNESIVHVWMDSREQWGKTLLFAVDIAHADALGLLFAEKGVKVDVLHHRSGQRASEVLEKFRTEREPCVLISVGMLTEGVDVPDARTAFLARPTSSPILMRQMVGRVLRGPAAGGESIAHVVDLVDRWDDGINILSPVEIPDVPWRPSATNNELPRLIDELTEEPIAADVLARIMKQYREWLTGRAMPIGLYPSKLTGFYQLDLVNVPVFEHTADTWLELITAKLNKQDVQSPMELFGDLPTPRPTPYEVRSVVAHLETQHTEPPFRKMQASFDICIIARDFEHAEAMTAEQRSDWIMERYRNTLAQFAFASFATFSEALNQELASRLARTQRSTQKKATPPKPKQKLREQPDRDVKPLLDRAVVRGRLLLANETDYVHRLNRAELPEVIWSRKPARSRWAYWAPRISGRNKGVTRIVVNSFLRVSPDQVSDDLLEFLLWHELCHHLTPGQGHDAEFRRLEALWPEGHQRDFELDDLSQYLPARPGV